jgi:hypothetical protein
LIDTFYGWLAEYHKTDMATIDSWLSANRRGGRRTALEEIARFGASIRDAVWAPGQRRPSLRTSRLIPKEVQDLRHRLWDVASDVRSRGCPDVEDLERRLDDELLNARMPNETDSPGYRFELVGGVWHLQFDTQKTEVPNTYSGLVYIARLFQKKHVAISALQVEGHPEGKVPLADYVEGIACEDYPDHRPAVAYRLAGATAGQREDARPGTGEFPLPAQGGGPQLVGILDGWGFYAPAPEALVEAVHTSVGRPDCSLIRQRTRSRP